MATLTCRALTFTKTYPRTQFTEKYFWVETSQVAFTCSKWTIETLETVVKYVQN